MIRLTREQVRQVDQRAITQYHIPGIVLMENAARAVTHVAREMLEENCAGQVLILCGGGNNGGDGLAVARHLHNCGADILIGLTIDPGQYKGDALINWSIIQAMNLQTFPATPAVITQPGPLLIIDAIFGTGLTQPPREPFPELVGAVKHTRLPVLAIDVPSGLDCNTGLPLGSCISATRTVTFVAEKTGFATPEAKPYLGKITVADIGCPLELIEEIAKEPPPPKMPLT